MAPGAVGLVVPVATGILPWLTPLAAACLAATMAGAAALNIRRGETRALPKNVVLGVLSALVAIGLTVAGLAQPPQPTRPQSCQSPDQRGSP